jgi:hypothetical protein
MNNVLRNYISQACSRSSTSARDGGRGAHGDGVSSTASSVRDGGVTGMLHNGTLSGTELLVQGRSLLAIATSRTTVISAH